MHFSILVFPGSNCDQDCFDAVSRYLDNKAEFVWHKEDKLPATDCIIIPGGFTYGDYLRVGAIAKTANIMKDVVNFANNGGLILGICNGFQILTEIGLLPGTLMRNKTLKFKCQDVFLTVENNKTPFTNLYNNGQMARIPIAHAEGNYYADKETYEEMLNNNQIVFRYCDSEGNISDEANPNGSIHNVAGICNKNGNILGLMPHPERIMDPLLGGKDGFTVFKSIENYFLSTKV